MNISFSRLPGKTEAGRNRYEFYCTDCNRKFWNDFHWFYHKDFNFLEINDDSAAQFCQAINKSELKRLTDSRKLRWQVYNAVCQCDPEKKVVDVEERLRILRAKRLVDPEVTIPEKLVEIVRNKHPEMVQKLWSQLEAEGVEVRELVYEGKGVFGFKIVTDAGAYLDWGTKEEILDLVRRDQNRH